MRYTSCSSDRILSALDKSDRKGERCHVVVESVLPLAKDAVGGREASNIMQDWHQAELMT